MAKDKDLLTELSKKLGITQREAAARLRLFVDTVGQQLQNNKQVSFLGVGVLSTRTREAREQIHPATQERIEIPAKRQPVFRVLGSFKDKL